MISNLKTAQKNPIILLGFYLKIRIGSYLKKCKTKNPFGFICFIKLVK